MSIKKKKVEIKTGKIGKYYDVTYYYRQKIVNWEFTAYPTYTTLVTNQQYGGLSEKRRKIVSYEADTTNKSDTFKFSRYYTEEGWKTKSVTYKIEIFYDQTIVPSLFNNEVAYIYKYRNRNIYESLIRYYEKTPIKKGIPKIFKHVMPSSQITEGKGKWKDDRLDIVFGWDNAKFTHSVPVDERYVTDESSFGTEIENNFNPPWKVRDLKYLSLQSHVTIFTTPLNKTIFSTGVAPKQSKKGNYINIANKIDLLRTGKFTTNYMNPTINVNHRYPRMYISIVNFINL